MTGDGIMRRQKVVKILENPEQVRLLENPNYSYILKVMREGEFTVKEIHRILAQKYEIKKNLATIYRYMEKLLDNDLVYVTKEEKKREHLTEKYYSRTAMFFVYSYRRFDEGVMEAAYKMLEHCYELNEGEGKAIKKLLQEYNRRQFQHEVDFLKGYGEELLRIEDAYGLKPSKEAQSMLREIYFFRSHKDLLERIFAILGDE